MNPIHKLIRVALVSFCLLLGLQCGSAFADDSDDVVKLMRDGRLEDALTRANKALAKEPGSVQWRYFRGVILTMQGKTWDAIDVYKSLTNEQPHLAEPYNNLAVLLASVRQHDKAIAALNAAIRNNPDYAAARENLGDVHLELARQAYEQATRINGAASATLAFKLAQVQTLAAHTEDPKRPDDRTPVPTPRQTTPSPTVLPSSKDHTLMAAAPSLPSLSGDDTTEVASTIRAWAEAWSTKDVDGYLGFYANDFVPADGNSLQTWKKLRRNRIARAQNIQVRVEGLAITINGAEASVQFLQRYSATNHRADDFKDIVLSKSNGKWGIRKERVMENIQPVVYGIF